MRCDDHALAFALIAERAADFITRRRDADVSGDVDVRALDNRLQRYDFLAPQALEDVAEDVIELLGNVSVRSDHPRYFGLFNPPALPAAVVGDFLAAAVNPQLAVWGHAPAAAEIERKLIEWFGAHLGWHGPEVAGTFTSGGTEANQTALLAALARRYPAWAHEGIAGLRGTRPVIYASTEAHLAWIKIARATGLGSDAVRLVKPVDGLRLDADTLAEAIENDLVRDPALDPVLVVATAGTTAHGAIDDIAGFVSVARAHRAQLHVDAAWAGGALLCEEGRVLLAGIGLADSVTIDPHKLLAVPMGAGMYLARDWTALETAFAVRTGYMPLPSLEHRDAYLHSIQWSRRFIGLKLFMAIATLGESGFAAMLDDQFALGHSLRRQLVARGWLVKNETSMPLVCFAPDLPPDAVEVAVRAIEVHVVTSGVAWISSVTLRGQLVLRACITSYESTEDDVAILIDLLEEGRRSLSMS